MPFVGLGALRELTGAWWLFAIRGTVAVLFGILALTHPVAALSAMVMIFGIWAFIDGIDAMILFLRGWRAWQPVLIAFIGIGAGLLTFFRPGITALGLYVTVSVWAITRGIVEIALAFKLRKQIEGELWMILGGIASIVFGLLLFTRPGAGALAIAWLVGFYAIFFGALMFALSFKLRSLRGKEEVPPLTTRRPVMP